MSTVLITGGTGLIGTALCRLLTEKGHQVIILTRDTSQHSSTNPNVSFAEWDIKSQTLDAEAIKKADHIIHLAGANVADSRWTKKRKKEIIESRTLSAALLVKAMQENENKVKTVVSSSGIGYYGEDHPAILQRGGFTEIDPASEDFLGQVCVQWEQSLAPVASMGKRLVIFRTGVVFSNEGGAIPEFKKPLRTGFATILGSGKQVISWIHIDDICRLYLHALENTEMNGPYNAVAHQHINNKTLMLEIAKRVRGKFFLSIHVPSFVLKIVLGELSVEILKSATVNNEKTRHSGFKFLYPTVEAALNQLLPVQRSLR